MTRARRLLIARVAIAVLLGTLAFAGTASAEPAATPAPEAATPVGESPVSESGGEAAPPVQLVVEPAPEQPPPVEALEPVKETPSVEAVVEQVKETPPPPEAVSEPVHEDAPPAEAVEEPTPEAGPVVTPTPEPATPVVLMTEQTKETLSTSGGGQVPEGLVSVSASAEEGPPGAAADATLSETAVTPSTPVSAAASQEQERSSGPAPATVAAVRLTAAQRAADLSCQLSGLPGLPAGECATALAGEQRYPASTATLVGVPATTGTGGPPGGGYSGSTGASRSAAPPPGPAPSGAFGGSAAGGAGGALSGFFTLAGLLLLAGPRAMRRLRLSCRPWLTAFFVLIPERPG
jgi:outer membrane biosynthesis protein TonB